MALSAAQKDRPIQVKTPLGDDVLLFGSMSATEELGRPFQFDLELLSEDHEINAEDLLAQSMTVVLMQQDDSERYFNGFVSRFSYVGYHDRFARYTATLRPWLWFLTRAADCRIFQEMTVPEIIKQVFRDRGFTDFEESLSESYRTWEYCVQYRETDFNFVSRLMECEGMYYYFKHEDGKHTLVLSDAIGAHERIPGYEEIAYFPPGDKIIQHEKDHLNEWNSWHEVQPGAVALNDFDFTRPKASLRSSLSDPQNHPESELEIYDYPGCYYETGDGDTYSKARLQEMHSRYTQVKGGGNARGIMTGGLFELTGYPRDDQNKEYLIVSTSHQLESNEYISGGGATGQLYSCDFCAIDSQRPFRPARITPKSIVQGPQTAVVVGKSGEEIWTDEHGRVKVQFHWDRYGKSDENSSCWVRVAQVWAGKGWGGIQVPRMGQEVVVEFLEGDPDRPLITGRVYNGDNGVPYGLPGNATQSGIKSRSSKGGSNDNFNEIRFEDKKGSEEVYLHAEKDHNQVTENDRSEDVGHDRSLHVGNDKSEAIDNNKSIEVGVDHSETIGSNKTLSVGANHDETIGANKTLNVGANHSESIGSNMTINVASMLTENVGVNYAETVGAAMELTIGAAMTETVGATKAQSIGANKSITIGKDESENVGGSKTVSVGKDQSESVKGNRSVTVTKNQTLKAKKVMIEAEDEMTFKTGSATIQMKKNGDITIKGKKINVKGSGDVTIKGSKINQN